MSDVIPHFLGVQQQADSGQADAGFFENVAMRMGEVVAVHYPDSDTNATPQKNQTQYTVRVQHRNGRGMLVDVLYRCTMGDMFGGVADHVRWTARKSTKKDRTLGNGSRVLIACPNGETNAAVIVGGIKHEKAAPDPASTDGHYFNFNFNGVEFSINDSGELALTTGGATDADGNPDNKKTDAQYRGSTITISPKTGNIKLANSGTESIEIDSQSKTIKVLGGNFTVKADSEARIDGETIRLGSEGASEPLVLGNKLVEAINGLVQALLQSQTTFAAGPKMHPALQAALTGWAAQYMSGPYLSDSKFTE